MVDIVINASLNSGAKRIQSESLQSQQFYYHTLLANIGYPVATSPVACLLRELHHLSGDWLVCTPIHWAATHNNAVLVAAGNDLQLTHDDSMQWFAAWSEYVAADGMVLHYHDAGTWLLQAPNKPEITAQSPYLIKNQPMMMHLQKLDAFWARFITESQMFFSAHGLLDKMKNTLYPVNGVWIWGGGKLTSKSTRLIVAHDESTMTIANILSHNTAYLASSDAWTSDTLCLFGQAQAGDEAEYYQIIEGINRNFTRWIQKQKVSWYWNNAAYRIKPENLLSRLLRRYCQSC